MPAPQAEAQPAIPWQWPSSVHFKILLFEFCFLLLGFLYTLDINPLSDEYFSNVFNCSTFSSSPAPFIEENVFLSVCYWCLYQILVGYNYKNLFLSSLFCSIAWFLWPSSAILVIIVICPKFLLGDKDEQKVFWRKFKPGQKIQGQKRVIHDNDMI